MIISIPIIVKINPIIFPITAIKLAPTFLIMNSLEENVR